MDGQWKYLLLLIVRYLVLRAEVLSAYSKCSLEDKQMISHTRKQLKQQPQVLIDACSRSQLVLLLNLEYQCQAELQVELHAVVLMLHVHYLGG